MHSALIFPFQSNRKCMLRFTILVLYEVYEVILYRKMYHAVTRKRPLQNFNME